MEEALKAHTRAAWNELGFFYDRDDESKEWKIIGTRVGLLKFVALLRSYAADPRNAMTSEHEHYGPYMYLELMTWPEPGMDEHSIHGPLGELARLASIVEGKVAELAPGNVVRIQEEFSPSAKYSLVLERRDDRFNPASEDANLEGAG
jgi:hypothetical protein